MLNAPATALPSSPVAAFTKRDVPRWHRFPMMRDRMADRHPPFMRAVLTATREDPEAPFDAGIAVHTTGELACTDLYTEAVTYTRTERAVTSSPVDVYGLHLQVEGVSHSTQGGQTRTREPGTLMLMASNVPFHVCKPGWARHRVIRIPRRQLDALSPRAGNARASTVRSPGWAAC